MAYEYAISAGPGTLMDYGAVELLSDVHQKYWDADDEAYRRYGEEKDVSLIVAFTGDYHDCETGR